MEAIKQCQAQVIMSIEQIVAIEKSFEKITYLQRELKGTKEEYQCSIMSAHSHIRDLKEDIDTLLDSVIILHGEIFIKDSGRNTDFLNIYLKYRDTGVAKGNQDVSNA